MSNAAAKAIANPITVVRLSMEASFTADDATHFFVQWHGRFCEGLYKPANFSPNPATS
jgi:hypothetical protein